MRGHRLATVDVHEAWGDAAAPTGCGSAPGGGGWCCGGQSRVSSAAARLAQASSTRALPSAAAAMRAAVAALLSFLGSPPATRWSLATASSANRGEVVAQVGGGVGQVHGLEGVAGGDALVEGGEDAKAELAGQGGLADQDA